MPYCEVTMNYDRFRNLLLEQYDRIYEAHKHQVDNIQPGDSVTIEFRVDLRYDTV